MSQSNVCTMCWRGVTYNGKCNRCNHVQAERKVNALPLMSTLNHHYCIGEVLGNGGFGITYSAWDSKNKRRVALKELFPGKYVFRAPDRKTVRPGPGYEQTMSALSKKYIDEANLLRAIDGQCNTIRVYDLFQDNGTVYYAMEFLEGCDLQTYINQHGPMDWRTLAPMMEQILRTLGTLHKQNLIHRDISPDNIYLTKDNSVRLIDFGAVRTYQGVDRFTVIAKICFAPWEQYDVNGKQGPWTDIYALSVTMYYLLTGILPPTPVERMQGIKKVVPIAACCPMIPQEVASAIEKGMSLRMEDRFQTAEEFAQALRVRPTPFPPPPPPPPPPPSQQKLSPYWLCGQSGVYAGKKKQLRVGKEITFGRLLSNAVAFPEKTVGVSRNQCALLITESGEIFVKDCGSSYGTFLNNERIGGNWTKAAPGSTLRFGKEIFRVG